MAVESGPPQLPTLVVGQKVQNGPYTTTVTRSMVIERERENREMARRWENARTIEESYAIHFHDPKVRRRFVRRVFSVLALQFVFTALLVAFFYFSDMARLFMLANPQISVMACITFFITFSAIVCSDCARRMPPFNIYCLMLMTISMAYMVATITIFYSTETLLLTTFATTIVIVFIFFTAACTKFDLTKHTGFIVIFLLVLTIGFFAMIFVENLMNVSQTQILLATLFALLTSLWLFFDVQTLMGGRSQELNPDEVVYATTRLYVDIILLSRYMLMLFAVWNK